MIIWAGDMGVGNLLVSPTACGVDEGTGVGITPSLVELQAVMINNPRKLLSININIFFILIRNASYSNA